MFDGIGARLNAIAQALAPECVAGSFFSVAMRLIHDGIHFFLCERRVAKQFAIWFEFVVGGRMKLDPVSAIVDLLSNGLAGGPGIVNGLIVSRQTDLRRAQNAFAGGHQPHRRNLHARTLEITAIDRSLDVNVCIPSAVAHQVPQGCEACAKILLCVGQSQ